MPKFELIAIDDHSTDDTAQAVAAWPDSRLRILTNPGNGLVDALNFGLSQARYPIVARMDADDLMRPDRLQLQCSMLTRSQQISVVGARVRLFPAATIQNGYREYLYWQNGITTHTDINHQRFVESPLTHPSVMYYKQDVIDVGGYRSGEFPEDYDLWLRLILNGRKLAKHPQILLDWRESSNRLSRIHPSYSRAAFDRLRACYLCELPVLKQRPVAFWGAGRKTRKRAKHLIQRGVKPWVWVDIDPKKIGNRIEDVKVVSPDFLILNDQEIKPFILIYVTNHGARELIQKELENSGFQIGEDFLAVG